MVYKITPRPETIKRVEDAIIKEKKVSITRLYKITNVYYPSLQSVLDILEERGVCQINRTETTNASGMGMRFTSIIHNDNQKK